MNSFVMERAEEDEVEGVGAVDVDALAGAAAAECCMMGCPVHAWTTQRDGERRGSTAARRVDWRGNARFELRASVGRSDDSDSARFETTRWSQRITRKPSSHPSSTQPVRARKVSSRVRLVASRSSPHSLPTATETYIAHVQTSEDLSSNQRKTRFLILSCE